MSDAVSNEDLARMMAQMREDHTKSERDRAKEMGELTGTVKTLGTHLTAFEARLKTIELEGRARIHESEFKHRKARDSIQDIEANMVARLTSQDTVIAEIRGAVSGPNSPLVQLLKSSEERRIAAEERDRLTKEQAALADKRWQSIQRAAWAAASVFAAVGALWGIFRFLVHHS